MMGNDDSGYLGCLELGKRTMKATRLEAYQDAAYTPKLQPIEITLPNPTPTSQVSAYVTF